MVGNRNREIVRSFGTWILALPICSVTVLFFLGDVPPLFAQAGKTNKDLTSIATAAPPKQLDPNFVRWRVYLDTLAQEARSVPDERRPYVVTDVALAYWEFDRDEARRLFTAALDESIKFVEQDKKKFQPMLTYVVNTVCRLDVGLAKEFTKRLAAKLGDTNAEQVGMGNAVDLLKTDKQAAIQLAKALAPAGLRDGSAMEFILQLSVEDLDAATELFNIYLQRASADESIPAGMLTQFAGFAFGWYEYYGMSPNGDMFGRSGGGGLPIKACVRNCEADANLVRAVLLPVYSRLQKALVRRDQEPNSIGVNEAPGLLWIADYINGLLSMKGQLPPEWQQLRDRAAIGVDQDRISVMQHNAGMMQQQRERLRKLSERPEAIDEFTEEAFLSKVESTPGACERDLLYMRGVTNYSYRQNFRRSQELLDKIGDPKRTEDIRNFLLNDMAVADIKSGDLDTARARVKKITVPRLAIAAMIDLTKAFAVSGDRIEAGRVAAETAAMIVKLQETKDRAGMYFGLAAVLIKDDEREARSFLDKAIKDLNKLEPLDNWRYTFLHTVLMSCDPNAGGPAFGSNFAPEISTIYDAIRLFSRYDLDHTDSSADSIADKPTKIRSQAIVARAALAKYRSSTK